MCGRRRPLCMPLRWNSGLQGLHQWSASVSAGGRTLIIGAMPGRRPPAALFLFKLAASGVRRATRGAALAARRCSAGAAAAGSPAAAGSGSAPGAATAPQQPPGKCPADPGSRLGGLAGGTQLGDRAEAGEAHEPDSPPPRPQQLRGAMRRCMGGGSDWSDGDTFGQMKCEAAQSEQLHWRPAAHSPGELECGGSHGQARPCAHLLEA